MPSALKWSRGLFVIISAEKKMLYIKANYGTMIKGG